MKQYDEFVMTLRYKGKTYKTTHRVSVAMRIIKGQMVTLLDAATNSATRLMTEALDADVLNDQKVLRGRKK